MENITPSQIQAEAIEEATRRQFASKRWHEERFGRIISSKFGEICKCRQPTNVCLKMLYTSSSSLSSSAILWGRNHEPQARDDYAKILPRGWSVRECGLCISVGWAPLQMDLSSMEMKGVAALKSNAHSLQEKSTSPMPVCHSFSVRRMRTTR